MSPTAATFTKNSLQRTASVGLALRSRREAFVLELEDIEAALNISKKNIASLEADRFEDIPEELYRELFLKNYAIYLGFEWSDVQGMYRSQTQLYHPALESGAAARTEIRRSHLWSLSRIVKNGGLVSGISACALYLGFLAYSIVSAPRLEIISPRDTMTVHDGHVLVSGKTEGQADVVINGLPVAKTRDGSFQQEVTLAEGMNIVHVAAAKKYSTPSVVTRTIFFRRGDVSVGDGRNFGGTNF